MNSLSPFLLVLLFGFSILNADSITEVQNHIKNGDFIEAKKSINHIITEDSNPIVSLDNYVPNLEQTIPLPFLAYSLRKLVPEYTGYVLRIRRSGDNLEADVSFDANDELSLNSSVTIIGESNNPNDYDNLGGFIAGKDAYVKTWYDQTESYNAAQIIAYKQPKIAENGALIEDGLEFDGTNDMLTNLNIGAIQASDGISSFTVHKKRIAHSSETFGSNNPQYLYHLCESSLGNTVLAHRILGGKLSTLRANTSSDGFLITRTTKHQIGTEKNISSTIGSTDFQNYYNAAALEENLENTGLSFDSLSTEFTIGAQDGYGGGARHYDGHLEELIIYKSDQSDNRFQIESNINNYYGLFKYNDEALVYKFIADVGYYYENINPDYLVENWNFVPGKTQTAFDYDPLNPREDPFSVEIFSMDYNWGDDLPIIETPVDDDINNNGIYDDSDVGNNITFPITSLGSWEYYEDQPFPLAEDDMSIRSQYRLFSIYNWDLRKEIAPKFSHNDSGNGYYHAEKDGALISFEYNPSDNASKQVNFSIQDGNNGMLKVYINGVYIAEIYNNGQIHIDLDDVDSWNINGFLPLVLIPGDIVTFEAHDYYWDGTYSNYSTIGPSIKPSFDSEADFELPENGIGYTVTYPNFGDSKTIGDIFATATQEDLPARQLLKSLIYTLSQISPEANVILPMSFTEGNYDIIIQYEDVMMLKSILELYDTLLSIAGQYNLDIPYDYDTLEDFGPYKTFKALFSDFPQLLETLPERLSDQADTKTNILSSLSKLEEILPLMFDRGSLDSDSNDMNTDVLYSSYLFTISDNSEVVELTELLTQINSLKVSLDGFTEYSDLAFATDWQGNIDKGGNFKYSLSPLVSETPFQIRDLIQDMESDPFTNYEMYVNHFDYEESGKIIAHKFATQYGFINDILPSSLTGNILVFNDENGEVLRTVLISDSSVMGDYYYSPFSGELSTYNSSIFEDISNIQLSYNEEGQGTWKEENDYTSETPRNGTFFYYNSALDLNENGSADGDDIGEMYNSSSYENPSIIKGNSNLYYNKLNAEIILNSEITRQNNAPDHLIGLIAIKGYQGYYHRDDNFWTIGSEYYDYNEDENFYPYQVTYYISNNDEINLQPYSPLYANNTFKEIKEYTYQDAIITDMWDLETSTLNFNTTYTGTYHESDGDTQKIVFYPSYLDLDNDGLSDGTEIISGIIPNFADYPSYEEIQDAIEEYENNNPGTMPDIINETSPNAENPYALTDADNDNMPDALELQFGGNPRNRYDAQTTLKAISSSSESGYSLNEIIDLRLGSTLYEVSEGLASFNIILEESTDLNTWTPYGEYSMELSDDGDSNIKFFRFKMAD